MRALLCPLRTRAGAGLPRRKPLLLSHQCDEILHSVPGLVAVQTHGFFRGGGDLRVAAAEAVDNANRHVARKLIEELRGML
jgi:hypothetical protein